MDEDEPTIGRIKRDDDDHHAVTVIASFNDSFALKQDMCLNCGSFGREEDGQVVSCSQCGQCFHSYCAGMNTIANMILERGWRCLDCTVCEGCGKATDEARLILCDDCDISYHIYCLDPPLDQVPKGNWKCKWCVKCLKCGTKTPGIDPKKGKTYEWMNNYTECAHCYSLSVCHVCSTAYKESELIVKCFKCLRWSHANCKCQLAEEEIEKRYGCSGFRCEKCGGDEKPPKKEPVQEKEKLKPVVPEYKKKAIAYLEHLSSLSKRPLIDEGIALTDHGHEFIKRVKIRPQPCATRRTKQPKSCSNNPDLKQLNDNSRSSSEEKLDTINDDQVIVPNNDPNTECSEPAKTLASKRTINFGVGGFCLRFKNKAKVQMNKDNNPESNDKTMKRKKKSTIEEMIPYYLQEAFFGAQTLQTCNDVELDDQVPDDCPNKNDVNEDMGCVGEERKISSPSQPYHQIRESFNDDTIGILSNKKQIIQDLEPKKDVNENEEDVFYDEELFNQIVADASKYFKPVEYFVDVSPHRLPQFCCSRKRSVSLANQTSEVSVQVASHPTVPEDSPAKPNDQSLSSIRPQRQENPMPQNEPETHEPTSAKCGDKSIDCSKNENSPEDATRHSDQEDAESMNDFDMKSHVPGSVDSARHQKIVEKFAEDEALGEFATQAMCLWSREKYPNLKNEMKDLLERYRFVNRNWRKLDASIKLNYVNESRKNRHKKTVEEKEKAKTAAPKRKKKQPNDEKFVVNPKIEPEIKSEPTSTLTSQLKSSPKCSEPSNQAKIAEPMPVPVKIAEPVPVPTTNQTQIPTYQPNYFVNNYVGPPAISGLPMNNQLMFYGSAPFMPPAGHMYPPSTSSNYFCIDNILSMKPAQLHGQPIQQPIQQPMHSQFVHPMYHQPPYGMMYPQYNPPGHVPFPAPSIPPIYEQSKLHHPDSKCSSDTQPKCVQLGDQMSMIINQTLAEPIIKSEASETVKKPKEQKEPKEPKQPKAPKEPKQSKEPKQPKEPKEPKKPKEPKESKKTAQKPPVEAGSTLSQEMEEELKKIFSNIDPAVVKKPKKEKTKPIHSDKADQNLETNPTVVSAPSTTKQDESNHETDGSFKMPTLPQLDGTADDVNDSDKETIIGSSNTLVVDSKVILNQELLNNYGISLDPTAKSFYEFHQSTTGAKQALPSQHNTTTNNNVNSPNQIKPLTTISQIHPTCLPANFLQDEELMKVLLQTKSKNNTTSIVSSTSTDPSLAVKKPRKPKTEQPGLKKEKKKKLKNLPDDQDPSAAALADIEQKLSQIMDMKPPDIQLSTLNANQSHETLVQSSRNLTVHNGGLFNLNVKLVDKLPNLLELVLKVNDDVRGLNLREKNDPTVEHKIPTTFKMSTKNPIHINESIKKLSELLSIPELEFFVEKSNQITNYEMPIKKKTECDIKTNLEQNTKVPVSETGHNVNYLAEAFHFCKFCDSLMSTGLSGENKENGCVQFCSQFCRTSYRKIMFIRKRKNLLKLVLTQTSSNFKFQVDEPVNVKPTLPVNEEVKLKPKSDNFTVVKWTSDGMSQLYGTGDDRAAGENEQQTQGKFETIQLLSEDDGRVCIFCQLKGDRESNGCGRLLCIDVDKWCHLNCALWSDEVYETMSGSLMNVDVAYSNCVDVECCVCDKKGASLKCFAPKCNADYHFPCAIKENCVFTEDKTFYCKAHASRIAETPLNEFTAFRNVWIQRDEVAQIQSFINRDLDDGQFAIRIGSLVLHHVGQLLPHQLASGNYHNRDFVYPVGYKATRFYWSINHLRKRARYECCINEQNGSPEFSISMFECDDQAAVTTFVDKSPTEVWKHAMDKLASLRAQNPDVMKLFPSFLTGEFMFGLAEPHVIRLVESLPGVETLTNYVFKFGRMQLFEMPLTINPTGCARTEPKLRTHFRKAHAITCNSQRSTDAATNPSGSLAASACLDDDDDMAAESSSSSSAPSAVSYSKQYVFSKSTQYKKLRTEWKSNVILAKSKIQGLGLYAAKDMEKNTMIIEYIGELIRNEVANRREKLYQSQNRGIYMFRLNDDQVVDATISGGLARYINHCCDPNCVAETVNLEREQKIVIIANKKILKGEELTYDYKFDFEDESNKISCLCGSANCKKWMN